MLHIVVAIPAVDRCHGHLRALAPVKQTVEDRNKPDKQCA
jgi:hypothetical protein